jgi:hypothetical protein
MTVPLFLTARSRDCWSPRGSFAVFDGTREIADSRPYRSPTPSSTTPLRSQQGWRNVV